MFEMSDSVKVKKLQEQIKLLEQQREIRECLPHLSGERYKWQSEFINSSSRICLLVAANQIGKSKSQIEKCISWATDVEKWSDRFTVRKPRQFWYLYPSLGTVANTEINEKWIPDILPRGKFKEHPLYGWKLEYKKGDPYALRFNSGVGIYFKSYDQNVRNLQTSTCDAIFTDEEPPENLYDELLLRLNATRGYFNMVFTATKGQEFFRQIIEENKIPDAHIVKGDYHDYNSVTMYDCLEFPSGNPGHITKEQIDFIKRTSKSKIEVDRRVFGKFVKEKGLKFGSFNPKKHVIEPVDY